MLQGWTGHYYILNTAAIEKLGLKESEPDPLGGRFVRDSDGKLTGLTHEYATFRLHRRISELTTDQEALGQTRDFLSSAVRLGITSVQNMSAPIAPDRLVSLYESAPTPIRMRITHFVHTRTSAYAEFAEKDKGTRESGKFADPAVRAGHLQGFSTGIAEDRITSHSRWRQDRLLVRPFRSEVVLAILSREDEPHTETYQPRSLRATLRVGDSAE